MRLLDSEPSHAARLSHAVGKIRLAALLEHFSAIDDPRDVRRITHPLAEILLLVVCGTIADCDDYDHIAALGANTEVSRLASHDAALKPTRSLDVTVGFLREPSPRWLAVRLERLHVGVDVLELRVAVRMLTAFAGLAVGLQAEPEPLQQPPDKLLPDAEAALGQGPGSDSALSRPGSVSVFGLRPPPARRMRPGCQATG